MLDIDNVVNGIADSSITEVFPEEDFAVDEPEKSSEEMWKLFENEDNIAVSAGEDFALALKAMVQSGHGDAMTKDSSETEQNKTVISQFW